MPQDEREPVVPVLVAELQHATPSRLADDVDTDIHPTEGLDRPRDGVLDLGSMSDIAFDRDRLAARPPQFRNSSTAGAALQGC